MSPSREKGIVCLFNSFVAKLYLKKIVKKFFDLKFFDQIRKWVQISIVHNNTTECVRDLD